MIKNNELRKAAKLIKGSKIYLDSVDSRTDLKFNLSTMPLLTDKTLFYCDSETDFSGFEQRLRDLIQEGMVIPVSNSEKTLPRIVKEEEIYILKEDLFDTVLFRKEYDALIQEDLDDGSFTKSCHEINQNPMNAAFSINWDVLVCEALNSPMIFNSNIRKIWESKMPRLPYYRYPAPRTEFVPEISNFLSEVRADFPLNMKVSQIKEFRQEKIATRFRVWLNNTIQQAQAKEIVSPVPIDKYLIQELNALSTKYSKSASLKTSAISGFVSALGGGIFYQDPVLSTGIGIAAALGSYAVQEFSNSWNKKFGKYRWVYLLKE